MKKRAIKIVIAFILFIIAMVVPFNNVYITDAIYIISYIIVGLDIVKKAIRNIFKGKVFDENFLMTVATIGAFGINEFPEAVAVMLFYQVGELFQSYAVDKSRKSIASLMDIRPDFANVVRNNEIEKVEPDEVKLGETIVVKTGEKIPLDGVIIEGNSMLDTMALTGESVPRSVKVNDEVLSGSINQNGLLKIKVTKEFEESTVSKILDLVENASNKKSKSENFITKFAKYYTPIVVIIAVIIAIIPPIFLEWNTFSDWLYRALSFLVVSCPCALVISIPLSFFGGIGGASKDGILIKGSNYLEALAQTEIVVFDKTGTLTEGVFDVQKIAPVGVSEEELLKLVAHAENYSNHPISKSIKKAYNKKIDENIVKNPQELSGRGISAQIDNQEILVGNEKLMNENSINFEKCVDVGTILYVAKNGEYIGYILIADKIKDDSFKAIKELKKNNILIGLTDVTGEGVIVTLKDNNTVTADSNILDPSMVIVHMPDILGVINELKNAGAEAISINDQRVVSTTSLTCEGNIININGEKISSPFVIKAIGSSIYMNSALTRAGGTIEYLNRYIQASVKTSNNITIGKYTGVLNPKYIKYTE